MNILIVAPTHREVASVSGGVQATDGVNIFYEVIGGPEDFHQIQGREFDVAIGLEKLSYAARTFVRTRVRPTQKFLDGLAGLAAGVEESSGKGVSPA